MIALLLSMTTLSLAGEINLSYDDALQRGLSHNLGLMASDESLKSADGALLAARGTFDPSFDASLGYRSSNGESANEFGQVLSTLKMLNSSASIGQLLPTGTSWSVGWSETRTRYQYTLLDADLEIDPGEPLFSTQLEARVTQALLQGYKRSYNLAGVRAAEQARDSAELSARETRQQTMADIANAYWALYQARRQRELGEQSLAVATEEARVVHAQVEAGKLAPVERSRVDAAVVQSRQTLLSAGTAEASAEDALSVLLGENPGEHLILSTQPAEPASVPIGETEAVAIALERSPALAALKLSEEQARINLADARHARLPALSATASYAKQGYDPSLSGAVSEMFSGDLAEWYLGGNLSVPLGNRSDRGSLASAEASANTARLTREAYELTLASQVRAQVRAVQSSAVAVELARANARLAQETLSAERALQEVGRAIQKDVLQAIRDADTAAMSVEQAHTDWLLALIELERLKGTL